jgi:hypothetical protein
MVFHIYLFSLFSLFWSKKFWKELITYFPLIRQGPHRKLHVEQFIYCYTCIRCCGNVLLSHCLATIEGYTYRPQTEGRGLWSCDGLRCHNIHTYIPCFIQISSAIQKLIGRGGTDTQTAWRSHKPTFIFSKEGKSPYESTVLSVYPPTPLSTSECLKQDDR